MRGLAVATVPLLVTLVVGFLLPRFPHSKGARRAGWVMTGLAASLNTLAMPSVGVFFLPTTVALVVAMSTAAGMGRHETRVGDKVAPSAS